MLNRKFVFPALLLSACLMAGPVVSSARAGEPRDIVKMVPADAWGFAIVKSLDNLDKKAASISKEFGLPLPPLKESLLAMAPVKEELDFGGAVGVVAMNMQKYGDKSVAFIVPAMDAVKLLGKFTPGAAKDGVTACTVAGEAMFACVKGKMVIISPSEDCCAKVSKSEKLMGADLAEARGEALDKSDLYISLSLSAILEAYKEQIMAFMPMIAGGMGGDTKSLENALAMLKQMESLDLAIAYDDKGLSLGALVSPQKGSDLEKLFADSKSSTESLVGWLPKERFLVAMGAMAGHSQYADKFGSEGAMIAVMKQAMANGLDEAKVKPVLDDLMALSKSIDRYAMSVSLLPEGANGLFGAAMVFETKDSGKFVEGVRKIYKGIWSISDDQDFEKLKKAVVHKADAETIEGKKVDTVAVDAKQLAGDDADAEELKKAERMLGKDITVRFGAISDKHVIVAFGGGEARYKSIMAAVKGGSEAALSADTGIKSMSENIFKSRTSEVYVAVDNIMHAVKAGAKAAGEDDPIPFDVPKIDAPVTICGAQQGRIARGEIMLPRKLLMAVKEAYDKSSKHAAHDFDEEDEGHAGAKKKDGAGAKKDADDSKKDDSKKGDTDKGKDTPKKGAGDEDDK